MLHNESMVRGLDQNNPFYVYIIFFFDNVLFKKSTSIVLTLWSWDAAYSNYYGW